MIILVDQNEGYRRIDYPHSGRTGGLGPCIGVGIYSSRDKSGFICHNVGSCNELVEMCKKAKESFGSKVIVHATGGSVDSSDDSLLAQILGEEFKGMVQNVSEQVAEHREYVKETLGRYFESPILEFARPNCTSELFIDTKKNVIRVDVIADGAME